MARRASAIELKRDAELEATNRKYAVTLTSWRDAFLQGGEDGLVVRLVHSLPAPTPRNSRTTLRINPQGTWRMSSQRMAPAEKAATWVTVGLLIRSRALIPVASTACCLGLPSATGH